MKQVLDYLAKNQARFIQELCEYVTFPSVSAQPQHRQDLQRCAAWLVNHCRAIGLAAKLYRTPGNPIVLARTPRTPGARRPHYVVYGHYDVQPVDPLNLWHTPPFQPTIKGQSLIGRGASDNKGQHFAHLKAVEAYLKTGTPIPCNLTFLIEGEEEVGCKSLPPFLRAHHRELACDAFVVSDSGMPDIRHPALTYALRGIVALEIKLTGPSRDMHSGIYGGSLKNPAMALCQLLASMHDKRGRVTIPGFYDDVSPLSAFERRQLARIPYREAAYKKFLGVPALFGERGFTSIEQRSARPTFEINGLTSGYQGEGSKTIIPATASAKLTIRLVPNQKPASIIKLVTTHLRRVCPPEVKIELTAGHGGKPYLFSPTGPKAQAALKALKAAFGREPILLREGGSIPIVTDFKDLLGVETLLLGLGLPDDNPHSPNEKFDLDCFTKGMEMSALLWQELAKVGSHVNVKRVGAP
jgi:acetylornithine deacetylase/succinyl-diaminopimelate desuccinylase-like protein